MATNIENKSVTKKTSTASVVKMGNTFTAYDHNALLIASALSDFKFYSRRVHGSFVHIATFDESSFESLAVHLHLCGIELSVINLL